MPLTPSGSSVNQLAKANNKPAMRNAPSNALGKANNKPAMRNAPSNTSLAKANNKPTMRMNSNVVQEKPKDYTVIIIIVVTILVVAILAFVAYKYITKKKNIGIQTKELIPYIHDAKTMTRFSHGSIPASTEKNSYNYNFWMYVNDYDYRNAEDKCVLFKGSLKKSVHSNDTNENPGVLFVKK